MFMFSYQQNTDCFLLYVSIWHRFRGPSTNSLSLTLAPPAVGSLSLFIVRTLPSLICCCPFSQLYIYLFCFICVSGVIADIVALVSLFDYVPCANVGSAMNVFVFVVAIFLARSFFLCYYCLASSVKFKTLKECAWQ